MHDYYIGLISGTSFDGIDAALVSFDNNIQCHASIFQQYPDEVRSQLEQCIQQQAETSYQEIAQLDQSVGVIFAQAAEALIESAGVGRTSIKAIGSHGQTISHHPEATPPYSIQLGNPNIIANLTGVTTVADFRAMDIAAGGQGAPLAPAFHNACLRNNEHSLAVLNLGGIANLTLLPKSPDEDVTGFDTGPANTLMDAWFRKHHRGEYDKDGSWSSSGVIIPDLLTELIEDPYFQQQPPKSTGQEKFNLQWLSQKLEDYPSEKPEDIQATLVELSAQSIADDLLEYMPDCHQLVVCGGGVHNHHLMQRLENALPELQIESSAVAGIDPDYMEAMCFAWLARQRLEGKPGNIPSVTGASRQVLLGGVFQSFATQK